MAMADALREISRQTGVEIRFEPGLVDGRRSRPVVNAMNADEAAQAATANTDLTVDKDADGRLTIVARLVVTARRDEAETSILVRETSTSNRLGLSLREQPRNTEIISAALMKEQQAQTVYDALRNAGGVSVNLANVQSGSSFSVRGFSSGGVVNGLAGSGNASTQSVANIERIEVLKGPDALLAGVGELGGTVNIVTKKPSAMPLLNLTVETGSYGMIRGTVDANNALNADKTVSARIIATADSSDHNYGGYRGDEDYLFAPSLRFKNANTDIILSVSASNQIFGLSPYVPINPDTNTPLDYPDGKPIVSKDQYVQIGIVQGYIEGTQKVADWLTLIARAQHQHTAMDLNVYSAFASLAPGLLLISSGRGRQTDDADSFDALARVDLRTGPIKHKLAVGVTHIRDLSKSYSASTETVQPFDILGDDTPPTLAPVDTHNYDLDSKQTGIYAQYLATFWKLHLLGGVRRNAYSSTIHYPTRAGNTQEASATTPSFGAVFDVTERLALFGSLVYGYSPTFTLDRDGNRLPDMQTRNLEAGAKLDLFDKRLFLTASWFRLRQSNIIITDPADTRYSIAVPGQLGTGIDVNLSGEPLPGWTIQGSMTRTLYRPLNTTYGDTVNGVPRDKYSVYSRYKRRLGHNLSGGLGFGVFGRSSASVDRFNTFRLPPAVQFDTNAFLTIGRLDVNLGVRNLFDRRNYGISYTKSYLPLNETRNWRLTLSYRFQ